MLQEEKERKKKEKAEAHLYTMVRVAREQDMAKQIGTDIFFDLIEHEKVCKKLGNCFWLLARSGRNDIA